jgi:hypothetical protein
MVAEAASDESLDFLARCSRPSTTTLQQVKLASNPAESCSGVELSQAE